MLIVWFVVKHFNINLGLYIDSADKQLDLMELEIVMKISARVIIILSR